MTRVALGRYPRRQKCVRFYLHSHRKGDPDETVTQYVDHEDPQRLVFPDPSVGKLFAYRFENFIELEVTEGKKRYKVTCGRKLGKKCFVDPNPT